MSDHLLGDFAVSGCVSGLASVRCWRPPGAVPPGAVPPGAVICAPGRCSPGIKINCFGSTIANWGKKIEEPFDSSWAEAQRAVKRMERLGTEQVRVMSFAIREGEDQMEEERFRRLRELVKLFGDAGMTVVHENCMNYGGM